MILVFKRLVFLPEWTYFFFFACTLIHVGY